MTEAATALPGPLAAQLARLGERLAALERVVVAYSGGVDSALLYAVARQRLGDGAVAATAASASVPRAELAAARQLAAAIGGRHVVLESRELEDPRYQENTDLRCYFCKSGVYELLWDWARQNGFAAVVDGTNLDDTGDDRPGREAARERGVISPLVVCGFTKEEVRAAARHLGLAVWDKPAMACLASRVPFGTRVTPEVLGQVERAEDVLREMGLGQFRVRHHGEVARLEVEPADFARLLAARDRVVAGLRAAGYLYVALDLAGYRTGSLHEARGRGAAGSREESSA